MKNRGMTLIEVLVTVVILGIVVSGLLTLYSFLINLENKKEETWKATKIIENIHAEFLANPDVLELGNKLIYYTNNLEKTTEESYYFEVEYEMTKGIDGIYHLVLVRVSSKRNELYTNFDLGVWITYEEE